MTLQEYSHSFFFGFKILFRPIKNFYELKFEKEGRLSVGLTLLFVVIVTFIMKRQLTRFIFQDPMLDPKDLNIIAEALGILVPFFLWCIANWCLTSLMEGDGSFKDIVMASGYALLPVILINIPLIILSWIFTLEEQGFYLILNSLANLWMLLLFFVSTMVIHQYSLKKTVAVVLLTIVGMGVISFIALLFSSLIQQMYAFGYSIYKELIFRL